ncbi:MAG TPA: exonuclease SbcCD subunit D [Gemmataceae bacterium]|jgi:exonuclease SbcD|nr:exonuclease SbcCD subunit D [Gemmataceae bacterium]
MRILHTADWHLGDRLGRIDRTDDLRRAVERIAEYCRQERADVLLVAGDLFSELARPDGLREAIRHLQETFGRFLHEGGTILAITGNHDNESFCQTLWHAMSLASPAAASTDRRASTGRLHLATAPSLLRLPDRRENFDVQFLLMPFPTPGAYLHDEPNHRYASLDEKNRHLVAAFSRKLEALRAEPGYDSGRPTVLAAHVSVTGSQLSTLFRLNREEDLVLADEVLPQDLAYIALGHIHKPQFLAARSHVRYSGSIERLDLGEAQDTKSAVLFDLNANGLAGEPALLPLDATPIYEIDIVSPKEQLPTLAERFAAARRDLVNLHIRYTAGVDSLEEILQKLDEVFPRWYSRDWSETSALGAALTTGDNGRSKSFEETVREYLNAELVNHADDERNALLERAEKLLQEE